MTDLATKAITVGIYCVGYLLGYSMSKLSHMAEGHVYTKIDRVMNIGLSFLSWAFVLFLLTQAWFTQIAKTGYWQKPAKPDAK